jgi:citrate (Re)-synthase
MLADRPRVAPGHRYPLQDVSEPNLFRDTFPYTSVPRLRFDGQVVPMALPNEIYITDTTFRDGQQARAPYSVEQIVTLYDYIHRLGGSNGVIRFSEFFLYSDKDRRAVEACRARGYQYPEVTGWIRANKNDFQLVKQMGIGETGILTSASDYHIFLKLKSNRREVMKSYLEIVDSALSLGIRVRCHLEDITRADFYGFIVPFAQALMEKSNQSGIQVKLRLCDTLGYGISHPGAELPRSIPKLIYGLIHEAGVPSESLEWHGHNDFHQVVTNSDTAWLYGCTYVNGSLMSTGERTGNTPLEALIIDYLQIKGDATGIDASVITEIGEYYERELGHHIPDNYPYVGRNFNVTSAGIHIDGLSKDEEIYNAFDTTGILHRPVGTVINDKSGVSGLTYWLNSHLRLDPGTGITKTMPGVLRINQWVQQQYETGRVTAISPEEILEHARVQLSEWFAPPSGSPMVGSPEPVVPASITSVEPVCVFPPPYVEGAFEYPGSPIGRSNTITLAKSHSAVYDKVVDEKAGLAEQLVEAAQEYIQEHPDTVQRIEAVIHGVRVRVFTNSPHLAEFWRQNWFDMEEWEKATGLPVQAPPRVRV